MIKKRTLRLYGYLLGCLFNVFVIGHGFIAGTPIETPGGFVPIEKLQVNDLVISRDKTTNSFVQKPVEGNLKYTVPELIELIIGDTKIVVDPEQRFYVATERKWFAAKELKSGQLLTKNGNGFATIAAVRKIKKDTKVYNLAIRDCHNFCVSNQKLIAHNIFPLLPAVIAYLAGAAAPAATGAAVAGGTLAVAVGSGAVVGTVAGTATVALVPVTTTVVATTSSTFLASTISTIFWGTTGVAGIKTLVNNANSIGVAITVTGKSIDAGVRVFGNSAAASADMLGNGVATAAKAVGHGIDAGVRAFGDGVAVVGRAGVNGVKSIFNFVGSLWSSTPTPPKRPPQKKPTNTPPLPKISNILPTLQKPSGPPIQISKSNSTSSSNAKINLTNTGNQKRILTLSVGETKLVKPLGLPNHVIKNNRKLDPLGPPPQVIKQISVDTKSQTIATPLASENKPAEEPPPQIQIPLDPHIVLTTTTTTPAINISEPPVIYEPATKTRSGDDKTKKDNRPKNSRARVCAAGGAPQMPGGPDGPRDPQRNNNQYEQHNKNNPNDKSGSKIKEKTEPKWEKAYIPQATTFFDAKPEVLSRFGGDLDFSKAESHVCTLNPRDSINVCYGKIVGWQWYEGKVILRADWDEAKGAHFNFSDYRSGNKIEFAVPLPGGLAALEAFLATLNTPESVAAVLAACEKKTADPSFENAHPNKMVQYSKWIEIVKKAKN